MTDVKNFKDLLEEYPFLSYDAYKFLKDDIKKICK